MEKEPPMDLNYEISDFKKKQINIIEIFSQIDDTRREMQAST